MIRWEKMLRKLKDQKWNTYTFTFTRTRSYPHRITYEQSLITNYNHLSWTGHTRNDTVRRVEGGDRSGRQEKNGNSGIPSANLRSLRLEWRLFSTVQKIPNNQSLCHRNIICSHQPVLKYNHLYIKWKLHGVINSLVGLLLLPLQLIHMPNWDV